VSPDREQRGRGCTNPVKWPASRQGGEASAKSRNTLKVQGTTSANIHRKQLNLLVKMGRRGTLSPTTRKGRDGWSLKHRGRSSDREKGKKKKRFTNKKKKRTRVGEAGKKEGAGTDFSGADVISTTGYVGNATLLWSLKKHHDNARPRHEKETAITTMPWFKTLY